MMNKKLQGSLTIIVRKEMKGMKHQSNPIQKIMGI